MNYPWENAKLQLENDPTFSQKFRTSRVLHHSLANYRLSELRVDFTIISPNIRPVKAEGDAYIEP